jgi:hypothetical protein
MADVTIEHLDISVELGEGGADARFGQLFDRHVARWWAAQQASQDAARFAESQRRIFSSAHSARAT